MNSLSINSLINLNQCVFAAFPSPCQISIDRTSKCLINTSVRPIGLFETPLCRECNQTLKHNNVLSMRIKLQFDFINIIPLSFYLYQQSFLSFYLQCLLYTLMLCFLSKTLLCSNVVLLHCVKRILCLRRYVS